MTLTITDALPYYNYMCAVARKRVGDENCYDLVQDVFMDLARKYELSLDHPSKLKSWLAGCVQCQFRVYLQRKNQKKNMAPTISLDEPENTWAEKIGEGFSLTAAEARVELTEILYALSSEEREEQLQKAFDFDPYEGTPRPFSSGFQSQGRKLQARQTATCFCGNSMLPTLPYCSEKCRRLVEPSYSSKQRIKR